MPETCVFALPVLGRWLIHAPLAGLTALANEAAVAELARGSKVEGLELDSVVPTPQARTGPLRPQFLGLLPTRACNLRCAYCGFGASSAGAEEMPIELAVAAVDWMAASAGEAGRETLDVHFFGGEPFAAPDVVEVAVHRARAAAAGLGLKPRLEAATNGACSPERARWMGDYLQTVVLSLDGPREIHDRRRPYTSGAGSFDAVERTARILSDSPAEFCVRVCVAEDNVEKLEATTAWLCETFTPATIDFEMLQPTPESDSAGLRGPDPFTFAGCYWRARAIAKRYGVHANYAAAMHDEVRLTFCPVGNDTLIISPSGRVSACYLLERDWQARGLDLNLGRFSAERGMELDGAAVERVRSMVAERPRCERCFCRWSCAGGCHVNQSYPGCGEDYNGFCLQTRIVTACSLLEDIGMGGLADALVSDPEELSRVGTHGSDRIEDWEAVHA